MAIVAWMQAAGSHIVICCYSADGHLHPSNEGHCAAGAVCILGTNKNTEGVVHWKLYANSPCIPSDSCLGGALSIVFS